MGADQPPPPQFLTSSRIRDIMNKQARWNQVATVAPLSDRPGDSDNVALHRPKVLSDRR